MVIDASAIGVDGDRCESVGVNFVRRGSEEGSFSAVLSREGDGIAWFNSLVDVVGDAVGDSDSGIVPVVGVLLVSAMAVGN